MEVQVRIPSPLKKLAGGQDVIQAKGETVGEVFQWLAETYPDLKARLQDEQGRVRQFITIYLNDADIRFIRNLETPLKEGDRLSIVPAIAGGGELKKLFWKAIHKTLQRYYQGTRTGVAEISIHEARRLLLQGEKIILLDVREKEELALGYLKDSVLIPRAHLPEKVETLLPDKNVPIVVYCAAGVRSLLAVKTLKEMGYLQALSMKEGFDGWKAAGYEIANDSELTPDQLTRYSRHLLLKEVGIEGQTQLLHSKVLLIGAGGLGSPAGLYLAAAGVGILGIIDSDRVDMTNLQRQVLHTTQDIGRPKTESAKETIRRINPDVNVITYQERLTVENALNIIQNYDIVLDGSDNFPTKFLVNDACYFAGKPLIYGGVFQFEGQASIFFPKEGGPCLRCLFPEPPPPGLVPS